MNGPYGGLHAMGRPGETRDALGRELHPDVKYICMECGGTTAPILLMQLCPWCGDDGLMTVDQLTFWQSRRQG